jgi:hypothetical protein
MLSERPAAKVTTVPIGSHTQIGLSITNLVTIIVVAAGAAMAYTKIPDEDRVTAISTDTARTANEQLVKNIGENDKKVETRIGRLESEYAATRDELIKMNNRMDKMLILLAGSSAMSLRSPGGKKAAERVRQNMENGNDPLQGLGLAE